MNETIIVSVNGADVTVKRLPLRKYKDFFGAFGAVSAKLSNFDSLKNEEILAELPSIIADSIPEFAKAVSVATDIDEDTLLDEVGLDEFIELVNAVLEVNRADKIIANLKKLTARKT